METTLLSLSKSISKMTFTYNFTVDNELYSIIDENGQNDVNRFLFLSKEYDILTEKEFMEKYLEEIIGEKFENYTKSDDFNEDGEFDYNIYPERNIFIDFLDDSTAYIYIDDGMVSVGNSTGNQMCDYFYDILVKSTYDILFDISLLNKNHIDYQIFNDHKEDFTNLNNMELKDIIKTLNKIKDLSEDDKEIYNINRNIKNITEIALAKNNEIKYTGISR
jgi:hypothetical protein